MSASTGQHQVATAITPVAGGALNAATVRAIVNAVKDVLNAHDADRSIHVESGTLANRPVASAGVALYLTTDTPKVLYISDGATWTALDFVLTGTAVTAQDQQLFQFSTRK